VTHIILPTNPGLNHLSGDVSLSSFWPEGFICIGVPNGTDTFVRNFVVKTCRSIIDDVDSEGDFGVTFNDFTKDTMPLSILLLHAS
jgi:hypothetical protein